MHTIDYQIVSLRHSSFQESVAHALQQIADFDEVIRLVFFASIDNQSDFLSYSAFIATQIHSYCSADRMPTWSLVAQKPMGCTLAVEIHRCSNGKIRRKDGYIVIESAQVKELIISNASDTKASSIQTMSQSAFKQIEQILHLEQMSFEHIIRQWNYIEHITDITRQQQHYQVFNDVRTAYYQKTDWPFGYPAATGIGTQGGGVVIDVNAVKVKSNEVAITPINNEQQIAAHSYSQDVLIGLAQSITTPKFERAKSISNIHRGTLYISGTAAILGEDSLEYSDIKKQTEVTFGNIEHLIAPNKLKSLGLTCTDAELSLLRIYLKKESHYSIVKQYIEQHYPIIPTVYLLADVCRDELLIEIEGIAQLNHLKH